MPTVATDTSIDNEVPSSISDHLRWVSSLRVPIFVLDAENNHQICAWNQPMSELTQISRQKIMGKSFSSLLITAEEQQTMSSSFLSSLKALETSSVDASVTCELGLAVATEASTADTQECYLRVEFSRYEADESAATGEEKNSSSNTFRFVVGFAKKIATLRKEPSASLSPISPESKCTLPDALQSLDVPLCCVDLNGFIMSWNRPLELAIGYGSDESMIGGSFAELLLERSRERFTGLLQQVRTEQSLGVASCHLRLQPTGGGHTDRALFSISIHRNAANGNIDGLGLILVELEQQAPSSLEDSSGGNTMLSDSDNQKDDYSLEWQRIIESANTIVIGTDAKGKIDYWNDLTCEATGYSKEEAHQHCLLELVAEPTFRPAFEEILQFCLDEGRGTNNCEGAILAKSGDVRYWLLSATPRRNGNAVVGMVVMAQDLTETIKYDRAVAAMACELRLFVETANAPIFGIDVDGCVNEWNDTTSEITGYTKEEAFGSRLVDVFTSTTMSNPVHEIFNQALDGIGTSNYELEFRTKSNTIRHLLMNATTRRDAQNNVVGVIGVAQDVTEAAQRDRAVAGMALELRQLIDTANAPIFGIDNDGNVNEWNQRTSDITGFTKEEAFAEPLVYRFIAESMQSKVQEILDSALAGHPTSTYELEFVSKTGEPVFLLVNATTRRDPEDKVVGVVGVAQDVTEDRKHTEELREMQYIRASQEAKVETERNMTAYFAHELRNPLGAIDSALNAMPDQLPEDIASLINGMQLCTGFMSSIMNNLLDVRKMEEGKMELMRSPISLTSVLYNVHKMLLPSVRKGVRFLQESQTADKDWVLGDSHRIQQVITNVVTNAIKYTVSGSVTLRIGWEGDNVKIECIDTGPGIPLNEQGKIFQRFVQRGGAPGTGLGLAIAKHLVDLAGGDIRFESDPSIRPGTTCVVLMKLLPCVSPQKSTTVSESASVIMEPISFLIVDDIKMNRTMLSRRVKKGIAPNAAVAEAATGEEALEICGRTRFDVIVVDQYMEEAGGVMVGTDVVFAMRRMQIDSVIIGCSGNDLEEQFIEAGANLVWQKPMPTNDQIIEDIRLAMQ